MSSRRFHITPRSALAGFLLLGGIQSLMLSVREPLSSGAARPAEGYRPMTSRDISPPSNCARSISPDGRKVAVALRDPSHGQNQDVWVLDVASGDGRPLQ